MVRAKVDHRYRERWGHWYIIPVEFRAILIWAFLNSGPDSKREYAILFSAMEKGTYSKLDILLESDIYWMFSAIKGICPNLSKECIYEGISLFFNKKTGNSDNVKKRFNQERIVSVTGEMLKQININSMKTRWNWSWMESWYLNNRTEPFQEQSLDAKWPVAPPDFSEWIQRELEMIAKQNAIQPAPGMKLGAQRQETNTEWPLLHGGRVFPLDTSGQEVEKTIQEMMVDGQSVMSWGYRLLDFEPDVPYIPFASHFSPRDSGDHERKLNSVLIRESDWIVGGKTHGLVDLPAELREAVGVLKSRSRDKSPLSHLVID